MFKGFLGMCTVALAAMILSAGCAKQVTKATPQAKPAPEKKVVEQPAPTPPPPADSFKVEDLDAKMREIFLPIYFAYDKYDLSPEGISRLQAIAGFLKDHPTLRVLIEGNADERGSAEYNVGLGDNRARSAKNYLTSYGISADKIETTSYGKERPANPNCGADESCHAKNRRDEWKKVGN
ncbi:MAG TPA: OmpA family protein [Chitinivibrionales bacterium]